MNGEGIRRNEKAIARNTASIQRLGGKVAALDDKLERLRLEDGERLGRLEAA